MTKRLFVLVAALILTALPSRSAPKGGPSRAPVKGCVWEKRSDAKLGLEAWVQRCDFGFRKIDFLFTSSSLAVRYSDGNGKPDPLVDVFDLKPGETPEAGIKRIFLAHTDKKLAARCVLAPYKDDGLAPTPPGVKRFTFVPNAAYAKELKKTASPDEVGDPPCGDWGEAPDGVQYFEAQPASGVPKVLFVRVGQDEPLFDERTLRVVGRK
ncbi:MAG TPA: hypothetical protein VEZ11_06430 [Thermoanaerobaculia bacterium]|nr:hypothetical protein [Thermoanaerobaculia bacterium]